MRKVKNNSSFYYKTITQRFKIVEKNIYYLPKCNERIVEYFPNVLPVTIIYQRLHSDFMKVKAIHVFDFEKSNKSKTLRTKLIKIVMNRLSVV